MQYMYDLVTDISTISDLEITCLIYAALLHDIGMAANETEIEAIKKDELNYFGMKYSIIVAYRWAALYLASRWMHMPISMPQNEK